MIVALQARKDIFFLAKEEVGKNSALRYLWLVVGPLLAYPLWILLIIGLAFDVLVKRTTYFGLLASSWVVALL